MALHAIGVRHHSPACARLVEDTVRRVRPRFVLVEGPSDMNGRLDELLLPHTLPVAIFSYLTGDARSRASWSPFCAYSPEWVALAAGREVGATCLFIDLPAWSRAFEDVQNRYADHHARAGRAVAALAARLGVDGMDGVWDRLFEQPVGSEELARRLRAYFLEIRGEEPVGARDAAREETMRRWVAWAMTETTRVGGDVVLVTGGYHAPYLEATWREVSAPVRPTLPAPPAGARVGSYLVPYSFRRLDSFVGYDAGMPSPAYYQAVWELGHERAGEAMLERAVTRLRQKRQRVSAADVIAASTLARGLAALRGHEAISRVDVLDGLAGALIKDALDIPLPWTRRGRIGRGAHPVLIELVASFSGDGAGELAAGTPLPPLVADAFGALEAAGIRLEPEARSVELDLASRWDHAARVEGRPPNGRRETSRVLHRLRVLGVPGFVLERAPAGSGSTGLPRPAAAPRASDSSSESWRVRRDLDAEAALIEAAAYGATLEAAAAAKLGEALAGGGDLAHLSSLLLEAARIGIHGLASEVLAAVTGSIWREGSLEVLGAALADLLALFRYDALLGAAGSRELFVVLEAAFERGLWLFEGITGPGTVISSAHVAAVVALRNTARELGPALGDAAADAARSFAVGRERAQAVMTRRAADVGAPPTLRGAALGWLWSTGGFATDSAADSHARAALRAPGRPEQLGDLLAGLFALAREQVLSSPGLLGAVDARIAAMDTREFLAAAPALRLAFSYFPPAEKEAIAVTVLGLHRAGDADVRAFLRLDVGAEETQAGLALDLEITAIARRYGLDDAAPLEPSPDAGTARPHER